VFFPPLSSPDELIRSTDVTLRCAKKSQEPLPPPSFLSSHVPLFTLPTCLEDIFINKPLFSSERPQTSYKLTTLIGSLYGCGLLLVGGASVNMSPKKKRCHCKSEGMLF